MNTGSTIFLRIVIYIIGLAVFGILGLGIPYMIVSSDVGLLFPILIGMYFPAIPFFWAMYQGIKLLNYIDAGTAFSEKSVSAIWNIKYCAALVSIFYTCMLPYVHYVSAINDAPGVVILCIFFAFSSLIIAVFAAVLQKLIQTALDIKTENDLTV
jgi:hypothetical protein